MLSNDQIRQAVKLALAEDLGSGDATTLATVPEDTTVNALMVARQPLVVAGLDLAETAFLELCPQIRIERKAADGDRVPAGAALLRLIDAPAQPVLSAERVALNFIQRLCGIATLTAQYVDAVAPAKARILDTRKTTPGWRHLEKYAVVCGGGMNYRFGLFDQILIKDNHLAAWRPHHPGELGQTNAVESAVRRARARYPLLTVEIETDTLEQVAQAVQAAADIILLDNMTLAQLRAAVLLVNGRARTEASGGVNLSNVHAIAQTGVDYISVGALTHSAPSMDIGLDFLPNA